MTTEPLEPTRHIPVHEVAPRQTAAAPAHRSEQELSASMISLPTQPRRSRQPWLIAIVLIVLIGGGGMWYWWTSGTSPIQYKTALADRGPITAIVTATGTINPVVSVQAEISSLGTNVLIVIPGATTVSGVRGGAWLDFDPDGGRCGRH